MEERFTSKCIGGAAREFRYVFMIFVFSRSQRKNLIIIFCLLLPFVGFLTSDEACGPGPKYGLRGERYVRKSCLVGGLDHLDSLSQFTRGVLWSHLSMVAMHLNQVRSINTFLL